MLHNSGSKHLSGWLLRVAIVWMALSLLVSLLPQNVSAAAQAKKEKCKLTFEVRRGDTLKSIAKYFGVSANEIAELNDMDPPYTIYIGQQLCIPTKSVKNPPKLSTKQATTYAVYFTAGRAGNEIILYTYNYPKTTVVVKAADARASTWKLYNLGTMNIAKMGNKKAVRFKLPTALRNARYLYICLKDKKSGHLQCIYPRSGS